MNEKVLLIDGDDAVRRMVSRVLGEENYTVVAVSDGRQALSLAPAGRVDLALLDLSREPEEGWLVFEELLRRNPLLKVVLMTEQADHLLETRLAGAGVIVEKPLDLTTLLRIMRSLLDRPAMPRLARVSAESADCGYREPGSTELAATIMEKDGP